MRGKCNPDEFKVEAVKQVTTKSLHNRINKFAKPKKLHITIYNQQDEIPKLKAELRQVTKERNILKEAAVCYTSESKKGTHSLSLDSPISDSCIVPNTERTS